MTTSASPATSRRRIVITGLGPITSLGIGRENYLKSLHANTSGIRPLVSRGLAPKGSIGGEVVDFTEESLRKVYFKEKEQKKAIKVMCREVQLGTASALLALADSRLDLDAIDHDRMGVEFGANLMLFGPDHMADACAACFDEHREFVFQSWGDKGIGAMEPLWMLKYLPNMPACHIAIFTDARGPNNSLTLDEASAGTALTEALNIMERSAADIMIVGGTGTRLAPTKALHARLWEELAFDPANPGASCKPFDKHRSGQVVGEGSTSVILEEEEHAKARGATIYGRLISGASSCVVSPDGRTNVGLAITNALRAALYRAGISASALGHINATGLGTRDDDRNEAQAIREVLGNSVQSTPVTSLKGHMGNPGAGCGFAELAASLLTLREGYIPLTLNCTEPDPELGLDIVTAPRATTNKLFAKICFNRRGQASVLIAEGV